MADWRHSAACLEADSELFFPIGNTGPAIQQIAAATAVCDGCPVRDACLDYALDNGIGDGVWGGLSEDQRRSLKRRTDRKRRAASPTPAPRGRPRAAPEKKRGAFVNGTPTWSILNAASNRGWSVRDIAERLGMSHASAYGLIIGRREQVTEATAARVAAADFSGPPPEPADAADRTAVRCR